MSALDGNFNSAFEQIMASSAAPSVGLHRLGVRVKGSDGAWGPVFSTVVDVVAMREVKVVQAEYFWDADPGTGNGTAMLAFDGNFNSAFEQLSAGATSPGAGLHKLGVRAKGSDGVWGPVFSTVVDVVALREVKVMQAEYFWDVDPGAGNGTAMLAFDGNFNSAFEQLSAGATSPGVGLHKLGVRVKGADGSWGPVFSTVVDVLNLRQVSVMQAEYFWDADPGAGNGTAMLALDGGFNSAFEPVNATVPTGTLLPGPHVLHVRAQGWDLSWGPPFRTVVHVDPQPPINVNLTLRAALQGCTPTAGGNMNDNLRAAGLIPTTEPYSALGYDLGQNAGATIDPALLNSQGFPFLTNVVDWVLVEFHPSAAPQQSILSVPMLLRRGGTIADLSGTFPFWISIIPGNYYVVLRHRNHLPVATAAPIAMTADGASHTVDFIAAAGAAYGADATVQLGTKWCLWSGDVNHDGQLKYTGVANDRDPILVAIGGTTPNNTITGYRSQDVNMDGTVKYTGANNDRDPVLVNIGGTTPNNVRQAQLP
ncbi:MAG: hypothetical protein IPJ87_00715 [Flavobacteriales bacterium]|nr:hypothetical protein [Flavobacteriales bacterium]MBK7940397.1 hypothetical protein [Flavobacteriales bacterium]MBK9699443.1 hypothetical protein [Flavobacteriales bacterium]